jgi:hypothetical protein
MKRRFIKRASVLALLLCIYPICVIAFTWNHVLKSDFKGGRNGQLDAYRHALAGATVSYTLGKWAVGLTTWISEAGEKGSDRMDIHNNRIGASIGSEVESFYDIEPTVFQSVRNGAVSAADPDQITWLSPTEWHDGKLW